MKVRGKSGGRGVIKRAMEIKPESDENIYTHKLLGWVNMPGTRGTHSHALLRVIIASAQAHTNADPHTCTLPQRLPRIRSSIQVSSRKTQGRVKQSLCVHSARAHSDGDPWIKNQNRVIASSTRHLNATENSVAVASCSSVNSPAGGGRESSIAQLHS